MHPKADTAIVTISTRIQARITIIGANKKHFIFVAG
jgi:hypothetical protein